MAGPRCGSTGRRTPWSGSPRWCMHWCTITAVREAHRRQGRGRRRGRGGEQMSDALVPVVEPSAVDRGRLHRLAGDIDHPAVAGDEPVGPATPGGTRRARSLALARRRHLSPAAEASSETRRSFRRRGPRTQGPGLRGPLAAVAAASAWAKLVGERGVVGEPEQQVARHVECLGGGGLAEPSRTCGARPSRSRPRVLMVRAASCSWATTRRSVARLATRCARWQPAAG